MQWCRFLTRRSKLFFKEKYFKFCKKNGRKLDHSRYCQVSLLTLSYHWQTLATDLYFYFLSLNTELGEPEKKKRRQESEVEKWARLDKTD